MSVDLNFEKRFQSKVEYIMEVVNCREMESKQGNPMWVLDIKVGDIADETVAEFLVKTGMLWKWEKFLTALGIKCEGNIKLETSHLIGKKMRGTLAEQENPDTLEVRWVIDRCYPIEQEQAEAKEKKEEGW